MLRIAQMFKKFDCVEECESMLQGLSSIPSTASLPADEDPCLLLAGLSSQISTINDQVLASRWRAQTGDHDVPEYLRFQPLHWAAQFKGKGIIDKILTSQYELDANQSIYDTQRALVSTRLAEMSVPDGYIQPRLGVDARDVSYQTALFVAAASGHWGPCYSLIRALADPNARDDRGHTILEVAAQGGHLEVVELLRSVGAELNPSLGFAASTPLQAAIESDNYNERLVYYLLTMGADVNIQRDSDFKSAIDIASGKGLHDLANYMRSMPVAMPPQFPPMGNQMYN